jgi:hypothetical protein
MDGSPFHVRRPFLGAALWREGRDTNDINGVPECLLSLANFRTKAEEVEVVVQAGELDFDKITAVRLRTEGIDQGWGESHREIKN